MIWNRFDEAPTELALHYATPTPIRVADADNAWLAMAGLGASPGDEPAALGRRRVDAFLARLERHPIPPADESEVALFTDPVPAVNPVAAEDGIGSLCPTRDVDCLVWALDHASMLYRLREANALRLQRFGELMKLPGWQALYPETQDSPSIDLSIVRLHLDLIAFDLASDVYPQGETDAGEPLERLAAEVEFWQRVRSEPQDLLTVLASGRYVEEAYWILSSWIDHASHDQLAGHLETIQRILAGGQLPIDWDVTARDQFQRTDRALSDALPGLIRTTGQCFSGSTVSGCLSTLAMTSAYAPQATRNLLATYSDLMQKVLDAPPSELEQVSDDAGRRIADTFPQFDHLGILLRQMSYNFSGRILANISIPAYDYGRREHDREALRRLVQIKLSARLDGIEAEAMPAYLIGLDDALDNPLNGQPFEWDAALRSFHFAPLADKHWKRSRVDLGYALPRRPGIEDCPDPLVFELSELDGTIPAASNLHFASCESGFWPLWLNAAESSDEDESTLPRGFQKIDVRRHGNRLGCEMVLEFDADTLSYRADIDASGGSFDAVLAPVGRDSGPSFRLRSVQQAVPAMIIVSVDKMPARALARSVARIKGIDLVGEQLLRDDPVSMHFEQRVADVMAMMADVSGLELHESSPQRFEFAKLPKAPAH